VSASLAVAIAGLAIALGGLIFTWRERENRKREIDLLRRQVEATERRTELEEETHEASRSANVYVKRGGRDGLGWTFDLENGGLASARNVRAWMIRAETGEQVGSAVELGPLAAGERTSERQLHITLPEDTFSKREPLALMIAWTDARQRERRDDYRIDL
jgi:hypothetical protein